MATALKRKKGGMIPAKQRENNGEREGGMFHKIDPAAKAAKLGTKTTSDGFARGGATAGFARGGSMKGTTDEDNINREPGDPDDGGRKKGGAAKRKAGGAITGAASTSSLAKRARGGRTSAPFSNVHTPDSRMGSSDSGHEGE